MHLCIVGRVLWVVHRSCIVGQQSLSGRRLIGRQLIVAVEPCFISEHLMLQPMTSYASAHDIICFSLWYLAAYDPAPPRPHRRPPGTSARTLPRTTRLCACGCLCRYVR